MENPVKFVNHEVADTLDSSDAFEGPEKLLELWFAPSAKCSDNGLLEVPRKVWEPMLDKVHCKVLSVLSYSGALDSYVLSESSFFVYPTRLVLKTCGTTTLLDGLSSILDIVKRYTSLEPVPVRAFYSHRGFMFPDKQMSPHRCWENELEVLKGYFPNGEGWEFGSTPRDQWYLFCSTGRRFDLPHRGANSSLELMMTDLDPIAAERFYSHRTPGSITVAANSGSSAGSEYSSDDEGANSMVSSVASLQTLASSVGADPDDDDPGHILGNIMTKTAEIDEIYPTANQVVDSFAFAPCGYSCNGVVDKNNYFTIHVTPENGFSYASFETNVPPGSFKLNNRAVVDRVLNIFKPRQFTLVLYEKEVQAALELNGYKCTANVVHDMDPNQLHYMTFIRS